MRNGVVKLARALAVVWLFTAALEAMFGPSWRFALGDFAASVVFAGLSYWLGRAPRDGQNGGRR